MLSSAMSNPEFAQIYWQKYLQLRRQAFTAVFERVKVRQEVSADFDPNLGFDGISGLMMYTLAFVETTESWESYIRRTLHLLVKGADHTHP